MHPVCRASLINIIGDKMWIQNVSLTDVARGRHYLPGPNAMLIQICDFGVEFPKPKYSFKEIHQFNFLDLERYDFAFDEECKISDSQAAQLVALLQHALNNHMNVVVHCHAGICRSGAVAEVGVMMGFEDSDVFRSPNLLVKHKMMKVLGWTYDETEEHTVNGSRIEYDEWGLMNKSRDGKVGNPLGS